MSTFTNDDKRVIKQFSLNKQKQALVHPHFQERTVYSDSGIDIYLVTVGHLWIYQLIEQYGFSEFLADIINYAINKKINLLEWELEKEDEKELKEILANRKILYKKYLNDDFNIFDYTDVLKKSKYKDDPYHQITRMLFLAQYGQLTKILGTYEVSTDIYGILQAKGAIVNAAYLGLEFSYKSEGKPLVLIPDNLKQLIMKNMECRTKRMEGFKYYPKIHTFAKVFPEIENNASHIWYTLSEQQQVVISKLLYSLRLIYELSYSLIGLNGILSSFVTRTMFDNYWQSKYLIENNKIDDYRMFALDRMRLHILKRHDLPSVNSINDLISEIEGGVFDPIPINGDYFTNSARDYAIELGLKDDYDKYYEYNSEFIDASLTAIYSGLMMKCENPEHNQHLTINPGVSSYINAGAHLFEIANKHIELVNNYLGTTYIEPFAMEDFFHKNRDEFRETMIKEDLSESSIAEKIVLWFKRYISHKKIDKIRSSDS